MVCADAEVRSGEVVKPGAALLGAAAAARDAPVIAQSSKVDVRRDAMSIPLGSLKVE